MGVIRGLVLLVLEALTGILAFIMAVTPGAPSNECERTAHDVHSLPSRSRFD